MDRFFSQKTCDRCGGSLENGRTMSMFNEQCICMTCKGKETKDPDYRKAQDREREEIQKGNFNFKGIRGK